MIRQNTHIERELSLSSVLVPRNLDTNGNNRNVRLLSPRHKVNRQFGRFKASHPSLILAQGLSRSFYFAHPVPLQTQKPITQGWRFSLTNKVGKMSYKATSPFALLCLLLMVSAITKADISCQSSVRSSITGTCQTYPADGLCGSTYAGKSVWIPLNSTLALNEQAATETLKLILKNSDQVTPQCLTATSRWTCANYFQPCLTIGTEDVPVLGCLSDCESYWNECRAGLELYLNVAM